MLLRCGILFFSPKIPFEVKTKIAFLISWYKFDKDLQVNMGQKCFTQHWPPSAFWAILDSDSKECECLFRAENFFVSTE